MLLFSECVIDIHPKYNLYEKYIKYVIYIDELDESKIGSENNSLKYTNTVFIW